MIWQPVQDSPTWQRADSGATIGGVFQVRVVVQPNSGYLYGVTVVENSISEVADHYSGQTTMGDFASVASNPSYGDPTSNVAVLQSTHLFLPHNATYRLRVRVRYWVIPPYPPQPFQEEAEMLITQRNLEVVDNRPEGWFAWDPATMTEVPFSVELRHAQQGSCTVHVHITHICPENANYWKGRGLTPYRLRHYPE